MLSKRSLHLYWGLAMFFSAVLGVLGLNIPANAACSNPSPMPTGFAAPCPVFSLSASSVSQSQTLTLSATPQPGTDYILTTAYISNGTKWSPYTLQGNNAVPNYSSAIASLTLTSSQLSALSLGTHYTVVWEWLWDATAQCYKGPGLNQCNTGIWKVQSFSVTSAARPTPTPTLTPSPYTYSQSTYYAYSQSSYYAYSQAAYYAYSQSVYYAYSQSAYTSGTTYYVSPTGSDSNLGTSQSAPWKTVAKVISFEPNLKAGDSVLFQRGGIWSEQLSISNVHGTASAPITFGNYGTGNLPVLDGGSTRLYGIVDGSSSGQVASSYVTIDGFEVRNTTSGGIIFSYLAQAGVTIQNNYVHNNGYGAYAGACAGCYQVDSGSYGYNEGIAFVGYPIGSYGSKIINNIVKLEGGHNAIMTDQDLANPLVQGNQVGPGCSHNCFDFKRSTGMVVKQNTANCSGTVTVNGQSYPACNGNGFYTEQGTVGQSGATFMETGTYEQNIAYGAAAGYACFGAQGQTSPSGGTTLNYYNNTSYVGSTGANSYYPGNCLSGTNTLYNNIFGGGGISAGSNCTFQWDYNDKFGTSGGPSGTHDLSVDPLFVSPGAIDFHLQSTSPVLNADNSSILGLPYMGACGTSGACP